MPSGFLLSFMLLSPQVQGAGLPELPRDLRPFLRRTAAAPPPAGPVRGDIIARAREIHRDLGQRGHVRTKAEFHRTPHPKDAETPAYVEYDFVRGTCQVFLGEKGMRKEGFLDEFSFRFVLYHELSHCHLFANPRQANVFARLSALANRMLSDYIQLEYLKVSDAEEMLASAYLSYQENYADAKAVALLLAEGWPRKRILEIAKLRETDIHTVTDSHHSGGMFERLLAEDWAARGARELDRKAREIADTYSADNILSKRAFTDMLDLSPFSTELSGLVGILISTYRYEDHAPEAQEFIDVQNKQAAASSHPVWRAFFKALRGGAETRRAVEAFFMDRYQARPEELAAADEEIKRAFAAMKSRG